MIQNLKRIILPSCLDASPSEDINPTSGTLHFVSNEARLQIQIFIRPDDIPEGKEVGAFRLDILN